MTTPRPAYRHADARDAWLMRLFTAYPAKEIYGPAPWQWRDKAERQYAMAYQGIRPLN
jgi:hypothetical protein